MYKLIDGAGRGYKIIAVPRYCRGEGSASMGQVESGSVVRNKGEVLHDRGIDLVSFAVVRRRVHELRLEFVTQWHRSGLSWVIQTHTAIMVEVRAAEREICREGVEHLSVHGETLRFVAAHNKVLQGIVDSLKGLQVTPVEVYDVRYFSDLDFGEQAVHNLAWMQALLEAIRERRGLCTCQT